MGVEVAGFEMVQGPVETVTVGDNSVLHEKENGKLDEGLRSHEPIQFGSHGEEPVKEEQNGLSEVKLPKDAVDEWPAPKQIHYFYFIRYRPYDDPKIKAKIDQAAIEVEKRTQARIKITDQLKAKRVSLRFFNITERLAFALLCGSVVWACVPLSSVTGVALELKP